MHAEIQSWTDRCSLSDAVYPLGVCTSLLLDCLLESGVRARLVAASYTVRQGSFGLAATKATVAPHPACTQV